MSEYGMFLKNQKTVTLDDNSEIIVPEYVFKARKRFRYHFVKGTIEKQCYDCETWFIVAIRNGNEFKMVHNEQEMHYHGKTFSSRCKKCDAIYKKQQEQKKKEEIKAELLEEGYGLNQTRNTLKSEPLELSEENKIYLKQLAVYMNENSTTILDRIVSGLRKNNVIEIKYTEKIDKFWE